MSAASSEPPRDARPGSPEGRVGSLFIRALEHALGGDAVPYTLRLRAPLEPARVARAYERQLRARPGLRLDYVEDPPRRRFLWAPLEPDDFEARLRRALDALAAESSPEAALRRDDDAPRLPFRLLRLDEHTLVALLSHTLANGAAALFWLEDFLGFLAADDDGVPPLPSAPVPRRARGRRLGQALAGTFWSCAYLAGFRWRAGRRPARDTVDLAPGALPPDGRVPGFESARAVLTREQTARLAEASAARGWSVTAQLLEALAGAAFDAEPRGRRLVIVLPTDRRREVPGDAFTEPGNTTGSITAQFLRARPLEPQVRAVMRALRRGVAYWTNRLLDAFVRDELGLAAKLPAELLRPLPERNAFESVTCVLSNFGRPAADSRLERELEWLAVGGPANLPALVVVSVGGRMTLQLTWPRGLADGARQRALLEGVLERLGGDAALDETDAAR